DSNLVLAGALLDALSLTPEATYEALFVVDGRGTVKGFYEYEGALYSGIAPGDPLFAQLKRGSRLEIDLEGRTARFSLGGSSRALGEALDYCDQPVPAGVDLSWSDEGLEEGPELPVAGSEVPLNVAPQAPVAETPNVPAASSIRLSADREREVRAEAETGAPEHLNALGVALLSGRFGGVDRAGLDYINRAAAAGYPPALVNQFAMATFQNASMSEAFAGLMRAADAGDAVALTQVGVAYESGIGVADDEALALDYFEKGRAAGDFDAYAHLVNYYGDATTYERYQKEALAEGHRMMTFNRYLYNDHGDRAAALAALIAAAGRPPLNERYDQGLRYLPSLSADSDLNLLTNVIFARRSEYSPWTPEEFTQIMAPLKARYGCQDGRLYMETTNTLGCARP
ncbi:MAG: tetratricopeptide repeat protein, partial [Pseudomonadota bacterium]